MSEKIEKWILDHAQALVFGFLGIVALGVVYAGYELWDQSREKRAQEAFYLLETELEKKQQALFEAESKKDEKNKASSPERSPELLKKDFSSEIEKLKTFIQDNSTTKAAAFAAIGLADLHLEYKAFDEAIAILNERFSQLSKNELFYGLLGNQLALAYSNSGKCKDAVEIYNQILAADAQKHIHSQALLRKGACLITLNEMDQAQAAFRQAKTDFPDSISAKTAENLERLVLIKKGAVK